MTPAAGSVLVVYPFCLDHVGHGNIQRALAIARYLATRGYTVDLVYQGSPRAPQVAAQYAGFRRVFAVEGGAPSSEDEVCAARLTAFYSGHDLPPTHMRPSAPLTSLVRGLLDAEPYRAVVATYAFTAPMFAGLRRAVLTVCDVQDVMHEHAAACERATGQPSSFTMPEATEAFLWRQWDVLVAITPEDQRRIAREALPHQQVISARHAAPCAAAASPGADDVALYAASDNQSNVQAATWLLQDVWPLVRQVRPSARLRMAGLICGALPERLRQTAGLELLGFQDDIGPELARAAVLVAPYLYGSGLKIKVVEAACAGKAVVTTEAGVAGSGLEPGRAVKVHDAPGPFAAAVAALLGDPNRRAALADAAREQAAGLFSAEACYGGIGRLLELLGERAGRSVVHGVAPVPIDRVRVVARHVRPTRVVLWGNGAHTRALLQALSSTGIAVHLIVDGRAETTSTSPEGLAVAPAAQVHLSATGDLVVLSSETFEAEMWRDLAWFREAGGHVLGLWHPRHISRALLDALSGPVRRQLGAVSPATTRSSERPAVVVWDSSAGPDGRHGGRIQPNLAAAAARRGVQPVVAVAASLARHPEALDEFGSRTEVLAVLELCGHEVEVRDVDGGPRALARAIDVLATTCADAVGRLELRAADALVVIDPSLSECFGLARALGAAPRSRCPRVVVVRSEIVRGGLHLSDPARRAYWDLAVSALADACDGRCAVVAPEAGPDAVLAHALDAVGTEIPSTGGPSPSPVASAFPSRSPGTLVLETTR